jgi:BASS family bile acid:Na+ symporter
MEPAQLVKLAIAASIPLLVFALGMRATFADATTLIRGLFRPPNRLLRAIVSMNIIVPAAAVAVAMLVDLSLPVKTAVLAMAVSPIPPVLPGKQLKVGGDASYVFGLLVAVSLASAMRHPGIAMAIASLNVPEEPRVPAAVILYLLIAAIATSVYGAWWKRQRSCAD